MKSQLHQEMETLLDGFATLTAEQLRQSAPFVFMVTLKNELLKLSKVSFGFSRKEAAALAASVKLDMAAMPLELAVKAGETYAKVILVMAKELFHEGFSFDELLIMAGQMTVDYKE